MGFGPSLLLFLIIKNMATYRYNKGSNTVTRSVIVTDAFVQNSSVEAEIEQPANSIITKAYIRCVSQPTVTASMDLGFKIGTTTGGTEIVDDPDGIIDAAANTTAFKTDGVVSISLSPTTSAGNTAIAADAKYTPTARTLFLNTIASNSAVSAAGEVEWILFFDVLMD